MRKVRFSHLVAPLASNTVGAVGANSSVLLQRPAAEEGAVTAAAAGERRLVNAVKV